MRRQISFLTAVMLVLQLTACGSRPAAQGERWEISPSLHYDHTMELSYAEGFSIDYYTEGHALLSISGEERYLVIPEGADPVAELPEDVVPIQLPLERAYLAASAVMDMFRALDALDVIRFSSLKEDSWYLPQVREAMARGDILYAGKYSTPDHELIRAEECGLAIENTMIYHSPEVKEQLERLGIPVLVDRSSYENDPRGRMEWIKVYGALTGRQAEAQAVFDSQMEAFASVEGEADTGKSVAFFYITSSGLVSVRRASDYVPKMIEMAGGSYVFHDLDGDSAASTIALQMEEFYAGAKEADFLIYNSSIDGEISTIEELVAKEELLAELKAVQEGNVFCTTSDLYQSSMELGTFVLDLHKMLTGDREDMTYLYELV